jgi:hypothetical protein
MLAVECGGGPSWPYAPMTLRDDTGRERLVVRYDCGTGLSKDTPAERGLAVYSDERQILEPLVKWSDHPSFPDGMPFRHVADGHEYFYFATLRVAVPLRQCACARRGTR